jgi:3-isopropylmalate/(R)-2-methylmalate dehydratase large subunit
MGQTIAQKILQKASGDKKVTVNDVLIANVATVMISEALGPHFFANEFHALGKKLFDADRIVCVIDHYSPSATIWQADINRVTIDWFRAQGGKRMFVNCGPNPQVMAEQGYFLPGTLVVGNDSHTCTGGAFGALAVGIGSTACAVAAATGKVWLRVPSTVKVCLQGHLPEMVFAKDIALNLIGHFGSTGMIYKVIEFEGECVLGLSMDERMVLSNMSVEMGAKAGIIAPDETTRVAIPNGTGQGIWDIRGDHDAEYENEVLFDVSKLEPTVAIPHHVNNVKKIREIGDIPINQAFIGSCTGGRYSDLKTAAEILKGKKVHPAVKVIVTPASKWIWERSAREGILSTLSEAGAVIMNPSCGPCGGAQGGLIGEGEVCLAASNRNFKGRMGSTKAEVYLGSPATVAASALRGKITDPRTV